MPKVNFDSIPFAQIQGQPVTVDSEVLGPITLLLKPLTSVGWDAWRARCRVLRTRFIDGGWIDDEGDFQEKPDVFLLSGGAMPIPQELNEDTLARVAKIEAMQCATEAERYNIFELLTMAFKEQGAWDQLQVKALSLQSSYKPGKAWPVPSEEQTNS